MKLAITELLVLLVCLALPGISLGNDEPRLALVRLHQEVMQGKMNSDLGVPVFVRSNVQEERLAAEVYGLVDHAFTEVADSLGSYANWCQFMPLNLNIKTCTWQSQDNLPQLTFYAGRKFYEAPDEVFQLHYDYRITNRQDNYVQIVLSAEEGPMGTADYRIELDAIPVGNSTFMRIHSSYSTSFISRLATDIYLATLGRDKVGFSVAGATATGEPIYVGGIQGVVERNAMRYYLALVAFLDTSRLPPDERFEQRLRTWFELTEVYALQLHELEQDEYLATKRKERSNQLQLQQQLNSKTEAVDYME